MSLNPCAPGRAALHRPSLLRRLVPSAAVLSMATLIAAQAAAAPPAWPPGMSFVAQEAPGSAWALYRIDERQRPVRIDTELEPRQACVTPDGQRIVYAAADGTLRTRAAGGPEMVLARPDDKRAFTQPCLTSEGRDIVAVEMADGKSIDTELLRWRDDRPATRIAPQPGAQHDPFLHEGRWLVYASVGCSDGCQQLLVEIWARDLVAAQARQLTLLNALSQSPVTDGRRVVFSSNASGTFQLWQVGIDGSALRQLTSGPAQATQPALCGGTLYFIQSGPRGGSIARWSSDGTVTEQPLPGLASVRALRCLS